MERSQDGGSRGVDIQIRKLTKHEEFVEAVNLQRTIWAFDEIDLLPVRLFVVASKIGGHALGAFDRGRMVSFCLAIPGLKPQGEYYLHSHMLGVLAEYRDLGVGRRVKLAQRDEAIARGIQLIEWTFDPLELKNAFFNIERLGVVVRRFVFNQYGASSSTLQGGLPTDRCIAEWYVSGQRAGTALRGERPERPAVEARIAVPMTIGELKRTSQARAREIQKQVSEQFDQHFQNGLAVVGFERSAEHGTYLLAPWEPYESHVISA